MVRDLQVGEKIWNDAKTRYITIGYGIYMNRRFEIWEKSAGTFALRVWFSDGVKAFRHWEKIKDEELYKPVSVPVDLFGLA